MTKQKNNEVNVRLGNNLDVEMATHSNSGFPTPGAKTDSLPHIQECINGGLKLGVKTVYDLFAGGGNITCNIQGVQKIFANDAETGVIELLKTLREYDTAELLIEADKLLSEIVEEAEIATLTNDRVKEIFNLLKEIRGNRLRNAAAALFVIFGSAMNARKKVNSESFLRFCRMLKENISFLKENGKDAFFERLENDRKTRFGRIRRTELSLKSSNVEFMNADYESVLSSIHDHGNENLLICDPPYIGYKCRNHYTFGNELECLAGHIKFLAKILASGDLFVIHFDSAGWDVYALFEMFRGIHTYVLPVDRRKNDDGFEIVKECIVTNFPVEFGDEGYVSSLGCYASVSEVSDYGEIYREYIYSNVDVIRDIFREAGCEDLIERMDLERLTRPGKVKSK